MIHGEDGNHMSRTTNARWLDVDDAIEKTQSLIDEQDIPLGCQGTYDELGDLPPRDQLLNFLAAVDAKLRPMGHAVVILPPDPTRAVHAWRIDRPENCTGDEMFPCDRLDDPLPETIGDEDPATDLESMLDGILGGIYENDPEGTEPSHPEER